MHPVETRPITRGSRAAVDALAVHHWGGTRVYDVAGVYETSELPGAIALLDGVFAGAVTWVREPGLLRIVTIASTVEGRGVGRSLLEAAETEARTSGACRLVVSTDNGNLRALGFYQRNGYSLAALHRGAIDRFRRPKPQIPTHDATGIPLRDLIDLEKRIA
ncbi:MAG TPA: GNAT family N-acetyltransferase [Amaricoccus sp.]|jgi:GNAT superfamily N-acetyltransferase|nr:GNAT family N-acetyltransferase [Amaricoccus sp.]